jgi:hypothetical protein
MGFVVSGGKSAASHKTSNQIRLNAEKHVIKVDTEIFVRVSKMFGKADNAAIRDSCNAFLRPHGKLGCSSTENERQ